MRERWKTSSRLSRRRTRSASLPARRPKQTDSMKSNRAGKDYIRKAIVAVGSGILLALAFPKFELFYLVFVALVPLFLVLRGERGLRAFGLGFITGFLYYLISLFWISNAMRNYSNLGFVPSVLVVLLLVCFLAALVGVFANMVSLCRLGGTSIILVPMFWVAMELVKAKVISGFPWNDLYWALYRQTRLIQIADILGGDGISFGIVLVNWLAFLLLAKLLRGPVKLGYFRLVAGLCLVFAVAWAYGGIRLAFLRPATRTIKMAIIQPNIPQAMKLSGHFRGQILKVYEQQAAEPQLKGIKVAVLPEAAMGDTYNTSPTSQAWVERTFSERGCTALFGSLARDDGRYMNSAFVVEPSGRTSRYDKVHLVPFGEYVPYPSLLSFVEALAGYEGSLTEGHALHVLPLRDIKVGVPICYEIIFPEVSREFANAGADLICTLSNDAWFGRTSGPYQHFAAAVFRAIENRVPVLRCANSGISGLVDATGTIRLRTPIFVRRSDVVDVPIGKQSSVFRKIGKLFAYLCFAGSIAVGIRSSYGVKLASRRYLGPRVFDPEV